MPNLSVYPHFSPLFDLGPDVAKVGSDTVLESGGDLRREKIGGRAT